MRKKVKEHHRHHRRVQVENFKLFQLLEINGGHMAITGVPVGGMGTFLIGLVPPNAVALQSGPTVSTTDSSVTLGAVGPNLQFTASVGAGDTNPSFALTVQGVNGAGALVTHTFQVPILPPPAIQVTDFSLSQVS